MDDQASSNIQHLAITAALEARWDDALKLNKKIIKLDPQNVDGLARLARAYMELGRFNLAKKYYCEALKYDPYNPIASKNLRIIKTFKSNGQPKLVNGHAKLSSSLFLQEPGKSKVVSLLKVAEPQKLSRAYCGMQVNAAVKNRKITIVDTEGSYLGVLPDDICHHLMRLLKGGNKYEFFIKSVRVNSLALLIRETFRSKRFKNQPSFLESSSSPHLEMITSIDDETEDENEEGQEEAEV
ncbi:tetratricopeptide repeat protein [Candidatus Daviesbacteria bacterium]|nr:tetratricopeptide repeat protein [Candidatus Daviesbacteria bacterium]